MKHLATTGQRAFQPVLVRVLYALAFFFCLAAQAATITFPLTNSLGNAVTNAYYVTSISDPILPDGTWLQTGIRIRITPPASGAPASTNLHQGNYIVSNSFIVSQFSSSPNAIGGNKGVIFAVPNSAGTYPFTSNVISGGNVYNYNGAQFVALYSNIVAALGFTPLSTNDVTQIASTNTLAAGSNITLSTNASVITIASTGGGGSGTNSVSPGALVTVATNGADYAVSAVVQTNRTVFTNDSRPLFLTNRNNIISANAISNTFLAFRSTNGGAWVFGTNGSPPGGNALVLTSSDGVNQFIFFDNGQFSVANGIVGAQGFDGDGSLLNALNASAITSGLIPMARITNLTVTNIEAVTFTSMTNLNDGTAAFVRAAVTNGIRVGLTNYVNAFATTNGYNPGSSIIFTTNGQAVTLSISSATTNSLSTTNYTQAVSNMANAYSAGISNALLSQIITTSNYFNPLWPTNSGSDNQVLSKTGTNTLWVTQSGGSGTGIQTNAGTGTNNVLIELSIINTNIQFGRSSSIGSGTVGSAIGGGVSNIMSAGANYSTIAGGQSNSAAAQFSSVGGGSANNNSSSWGTIAGGLGNGMGGTGNTIGGGQGNGIGSTTVGNTISGGYSNSVGNNAAYNTIVGGFQNNATTGTGNYNTILGGVSNTVAGAAVRGTIIGISNTISGIVYNSIAIGTRAVASHNNVFVYSDGSQSSFVSAVSNSLPVLVQNGLSINTNDSRGNDLFVNGRLAADTYRIRDLTNAAVNTNVLVVAGSGTAGVNGMYYYLGPQYTNLATGSTVTNNAGTWVVKILDGTSIDSSTSLVSTNWTLLVGSGIIRSDYGTFIYGNGPWVGQFQSTNMTYQLTNYVKVVYPTNDASASNNYVLSKIGSNAYWVQGVFDSNTVVNIIHSNTVASSSILGAPGSLGTSFDGAALTNLTQFIPRIYYVTTNGSDSASGLTSNTAFATPYKASSVAVSGDTIQMGSGSWNIGTNQIVLAQGVNLYGLGMNVTEIIGDADCAGVESGKPSGGPQICCRENNVLRGFTITCDTNALWTGFNGGIASAGATHTGTWSGIGVSFLNVPAHVGATNLLVEDVKIRRGYFDCFHFNVTNQISVTLRRCITESDGGDCVNSVIGSPNTVEANRGSIRAEDCKFGTIANTLYSAYVNGSNPGMFGGNCSVYNGYLEAGFYNCQGYPVGNGDIGASIVSGSPTNTVTMIGGKYTGVVNTFYESNLSGWTLWNSSNVFGVRGVQK